MDLIRAYRKAIQRYLPLPDFTGVAIGWKEIGGKLIDEIGLTFFVPFKTNNPRVFIPRKLWGIETDIVEAVFHAPPPIMSVNMTEKASSECTDYRSLIHRPTPAGVSIGHLLVTAGTLGGYFRWRGRWVALSNKHVLAPEGKSNVGDEIYQAGMYDLLRLKQDIIKGRWGTLRAFVPIDMIGEGECPIGKFTKGVFNILSNALGRHTYLVQMTFNEVDCAIAEPTTQDFVLNEVIGIGEITGIRTDYKRMMEEKTRVWGSGRTTCVREGYVAYYPMAINVSYGVSGFAVFWKQVGFRTDKPPFIQGGDSGSLAFDEDKRVVALRFAGSRDGNLGVGNRIDLVMEKLKLNL